MANNNRPRAGVNRASLKSGAPRRPRVDDDVHMPSQRVAVLRPAPAPSLLKDSLQVIGGVAATLAAIAALLGILHLIRDSVAVGKHLAEAKSQRSILVCQDGRIVRGDGSLRDIIMEDGYFVCTDWRTLQRIELEESKGR